MRHLRQEIKRISDLVLPDNFEEIKQHPNVPIYAESIRTSGMMQLPGVEDKTNTLDWGRKRVAAYLLLGQSHVPVSIVAYDYPEEKAILTERENLERHELTPEERRASRLRIIELEEQKAERERREADDAAFTDDGPQLERDPEFSGDAGVLNHDARKLRVKPGRPSKGRAEAAKKLNMSVAQVQREVRRKKAQEKAAEESAEPATPAAPIELHGLTMDANELEKIRDIQVALDNAAAAMRKAMGLVKPLGQLDNYPRERFQKFYGEMKFIASLLKQGRPSWVCLDCKLVPALRAKCPRCMSAGYIVEEQTEEIPEELKRTGDAAGVFINGKFKALKGLIK